MHFSGSKHVIPEPTDIDQIYQVLKKAGEISSSKITAASSIAVADKINAQNQAMTNTNAASDSNVASSIGGASSNIQIAIPVVNMPDYPDRKPMKGPVKSKGSNHKTLKQGLTAPTTKDISCSGPNFFYLEK